MRRRSLRQMLLDAPVGVVEPMLGGLLLVCATLVHVLARNDWGVLGLDAFGCCTMVVAGRWPRLGGFALLTFLVANLLLPPGVATLGQFGILVSVLGLGMRGHVFWRRGLTAAYLSLMVADLLRQSPNPLAVLDPMLGFGLGVAAAWLIGDAFSRARRQQQTIAQAAVLSDRLATARDLHDTVAHTLSLISLRAQRAELREEATPEDLRFFAEASAQSVQELRAIMSLLRSEADEERESSRRVPLLSETVEAAVARLRSAEFLVSLTVDGDLDAVPASRVATLDKVAREAINNVIKHGIRGSNCRVLVGVADCEVTLAIINRVPVEQPEVVTDPHLALGVTGMRERVAALGGTLSSERVGNNWVMQVSMPLGVSSHQRRPAGTRKAKA